MNFCDLDASGASIFENSATRTQMPGTVGRTRDGRIFRYILAGTPALVAGNVIQSAATVPNHLARTPVAAAIGDTQVTVALGGTLASENQYAGGLLIVSVTPGLGQSLAISGHPAAALSTNLVVTLDSGSPVQVALTTTSRVGLQSNLWRNVIQAPVTTATGVAVGVAVGVVTAAQYGWVQTFGPCGVLIDGTPAVGASVVGTGAVAGAATIASTTLGVIGRMITVGVDTTVCAVFLQVD